MDGVKVITWNSSGKTDDLENINIMGASGEVVAIKAVLAAWEWISVLEVSHPPIPFCSNIFSSVHLAGMELLINGMEGNVTGGIGRQL